MIKHKWIEHWFIPCLFSETEIKFKEQLKKKYNLSNIFTSLYLDKKAKYT